MQKKFYWYLQSSDLQLKSKLEPAKKKATKTILRVRLSIQQFENERETIFYAEL